MDPPEPCEYSACSARPGPKESAFQAADVREKNLNICGSCHAVAVSVFECGASLVKRVVIRFICVCLVPCSVRMSKGGRAPPFEEVFQAEKCQCVDSFSACELRGELNCFNISLSFVK